MTARVVVAVALILSACGGGSDDTADLQRQVEDLRAQLEETQQQLEEARAGVPVTTARGPTDESAVTTTASPQPESTTTSDPPRATTSSSTTTTTTTTTTRPPPSDVRAAWTPTNDSTWGPYDGTASYTIFCWECPPPKDPLPECLPNSCTTYTDGHYEHFRGNQPFGLDIASFPSGSVLNDFSIYLSTDFNGSPERIRIQVGPSYHDLPQLTLSVDVLTLEPSRRYPFRLELAKQVDQYGGTVITGSAVEYELLADGTLRESIVFDVFTVALREES